MVTILGSETFDLNHDPKCSLGSYCQQASSIRSAECRYYGTPLVTGGYLCPAGTVRRGGAPQGRDQESNVKRVVSDYKNALLVPGSQIKVMINIQPAARPGAARKMGFAVVWLVVDKP